MREERVLVFSSPRLISPLKSQPKLKWQVVIFLPLCHSGSARPKYDVMPNNSLSSLSQAHPHIHAPTHKRTHTYTHPHIHAPTHTRINTCPDQHKKTQEPNWAPEPMNRTSTHLQVTSNFTIELLLRTLYLCKSIDWHWLGLLKFLKLRVTCRKKY